VYGNRSAWESAIPAESDFIGHPAGHGWRLDRPAFHAQLVRSLRAAHIPLLIAGVQTLERDRRARWTLAVSSGDEIRRIHTDFLVDASGRSRRIVRRLGVPRRTYDRLTAAVGVFRAGDGTEDRDSRTQVEAGRHGWWYAGLLPDGRLATGYLTDADSPTARQARSREGFLALLSHTEHLSERVRSFGYTLAGAPQSVPAQSSRLRRAAGDGWCAVGDAYATHDPLSSGGILTALETGRWGAEAIVHREGGGLTRFDQRCCDGYARYLAQWLGYYALVTRWPAETFWKRRHDALDGVLSENGQEGDRMWGATAER
jgi:flavin-dependent dehydrogenase